MLSSFGCLGEIVSRKALQGIVAETAPTVGTHTLAM